MPEVTESRQASQPAESRDSWRDALEPIPEILTWYKDHAAAGTLIVAAFLVAKGYVIAKGDLTTALGILQYAGVASVVVSGLLSSLPILTASLLGWMVFQITRGPFSGSPSGSRVPRAIVLVGAFVLAAFFTQVPYMLIAIGLGLLAGLIERWHPSKWLVWIARSLVGIFGALAIVLMLYAVWVPHEVVELRAPTASAEQQPNEQVGYVLADDPGGWITILTSGDREIVRFRDSAVQSIRVCQKVPRGGLSDVFYASTLWSATSRFVANLRPGSYIQCPK